MFSIKFRFIIIHLLILFLFSNCDTKKKIDDNLQMQFACYSLAICTNDRGTKFGMVGDSWTDLVFGVNAIETLRVQLEKYHNYQIKGATLGGTTLSGAYQRGAHIQTIDEAGPSIKYVLVSLGGNDLQFTPSAYVNNFSAEKQSRFLTISGLIKDMITSGNAYKLNKWGGDPLIGIFHGYDYPNPDNANGSTSCRDTLKAAGFTDTQVDVDMKTLLDDYNSLLYNLVFQIENFRYINLRSTLGTSVSEKQYMFDCIHPNSIGFRLLGNRYVLSLEAYTRNER